MQRSVNQLVGYTIQASDGELGRVEEFYFDDASWTVRYLVVRVGRWHHCRRVLLSPVALGTPEWGSRRFPVRLSLEQVRHSPDIDTDKPVYRQHEIQLHQHYAWPFYWGAGPFPAGGISPVLPVVSSRGRAETPDPSPGAVQPNPHLRSSWHVTGYAVHARDGEVGHIADYTLGDQSWAIRYLVVDTGNWLPGMRVSVESQLATRISWDEATVFLDLPREFFRHRTEDR